MTNEPPDPQPENGSNILYTGKFLRIRKIDHWEYVERLHARGIVAILAVTEQRELVLVEEYRVPVGRNVIAIPAGIAGDLAGSETEELAEAAKRELLEETGYRAEGMEFLTDGPPSAGLSTEVVTFFRAHGLTRVSAGGGDGTENIRVHVVPLTQLEEWIETKRGEGCLIDCKLYTALYFYLKRG